MTIAHEAFTRLLAVQESSHEGFDAGDPELTAPILRHARAAGVCPGFLHRTSYDSGPMVVSPPTADTSPEVMHVLTTEGVEAWKAFVARQAENPDS